MEWLHQGCDSDFSADFVNVGTGGFPFKNPLKKVLQNRSFFVLASRSRFGV